jgi:predicted O-methyltransferase YrrM
VDGATENFVSNLVCALLVAQGGSVVLETGSFKGHTSLALYKTLTAMGGGTLLLAEIDPERAIALDEMFAAQQISHGTSVAWKVYQDDVLNVISSLADESLDFAFCDDDHEKAHVAAEIDALLPKMAPDGILTFHDVFGSVDLQEVVRRYGGYALKFPMLGPAGGLGIIQVP